MNQIIYGDESVISELMYSSRSDDLIMGLKHNLGVQNQMLTEQGRLYAQHANKVFEQVAGWDAVRATRKAAAAVTGYVQSNAILALTTLEEIQTANPRMQRWMMADIQTRTLYQAGRIDGYSETYIDIQPGVLGRDHYDYTLATHTVVQTHETEETLKYEVTQIQRELASWDEPLQVRGRLDIARTWQAQRALQLEGADDPHSRFGGKI